MQIFSASCISYCSTNSRGSALPFASRRMGVEIELIV